MVCCEGLEEIAFIPGGGFAFHVEACLFGDGLDGVEGGVSHGGPIGRSVFGAPAHEVVVEDDVHDPVPAIFYAPVGAHGSGELFGREGGRGQVIAAGQGGLAVAFDFRLDPGGGGEIRGAGVFRGTPGAG